MALIEPYGPYSSYFHISRDFLLLAFGVVITLLFEADRVKDISLESAITDPYLPGRWHEPLPPPPRPSALCTVLQSLVPPVPESSLRAFLQFLVSPIFNAADEGFTGIAVKE